ncbi:2OG-Fe(II) oxygenase [Stenotrophomonas sp.]|uniref:2OG-Fe(II) oxygenase n=1 Tax=Stenotrophomonas sp. TaxID=69392 RepID=UPI002FC98D16
MTADTQPDFIEVIHNAIPAETCAAIQARMRTSAQLRPGEVGSGVFPELKHSKDLRITGDAAWRDVDMLLQQAVFRGVMSYLRRYPQALISPLMLQIQDSDGNPRRLAAEDFTAMDDATLSDLARTCLRPGAINLQWYAAGEGGYPYWHCELYPRDPAAETLHRHLLWTLYLNDDFEQGETEFLFQGRKIAPRTGSLLIAPTAFTHTHRGNRPQGGDKFIATSWVLFQSAQKLFGNSG